MEGWVKLFRQLREWQWYSNSNVKALFIHCLIAANHADLTWQNNTIKRGSFVTSLGSLSSELGMTIKQIRLCIFKLKSSGEIDAKGTNKFTIITVCNYDIYQAFEDEEGQTKGKQRANKGQTKGKQRATNNNNKNNIESVSAREENFENSDFESRLSDDQNWCEILAMNYHLTVDAVRTLVTEAAATFRLDNEPPRDYSSFRQRCRQYINAHYKRFTQNNLKPNNYGNTQSCARQIGSDNPDDYRVEWAKY